MQKSLTFGSCEEKWLFEVNKKSSRVTLLADPSWHLPGLSGESLAWRYNHIRHNVMTRTKDAIVTLKINWRKRIHRKNSHIFIHTAKHYAKVFSDLGWHYSGLSLSPGPGSGTSSCCEQRGKSNCKSLRFLGKKGNVLGRYFCLKKQIQIEMFWWDGGA